MEDRCRLKLSHGREHLLRLAAVTKSSAGGADVDMLDGIGPSQNSHIPSRVKQMPDQMRPDEAGRPRNQRSFGCMPSSIGPDEISYAVKSSSKVVVKHERSIVAGAVVRLGAPFTSKSVNTACFR